MNRAIFLDRDGTLNEEVSYLKSPDKLRLIPRAADALRIFKSLGFLNIIVSNQSGIARGYLTEEELAVIHSELIQRLESGGSKLIDDVYYSPFHKDGVIEKYRTDSPMRKPSPGMVLRAAEEHGISLKESFLVGDSLTDMQCAENAGVAKILVSTGYGRDDYRRCIDGGIEPDYFAKDIYDAALFVKEITERKN